MNAPHSTRAAHWENVYQTKSDRETSWFQDQPIPSIDLIRQYAPPKGRVIDVGGGSSALAGQLAAEDFRVSVLDISAAAIERAKRRIGEIASRVQWIVADIAEIDRLGEFDLWHDRAVFHFLTDVNEQRAYAALAARSVVPGGHLIIAAFASDGPEKCSGLPVHRYDEPAMRAAFAPAFSLVRSLRQTHLTPWGKPQPFLFTIMRRGT